MADLDLDKLEADAKAATPGPWKVDGVWIEAGLRDVIAPGEVACSSSCLGGSSRITGDNFEADYRHIANMDPTTTLALIERLRTAEAKVAAALKEIGDVSDLDPQQGGCEGARDETLLAIHAALTGQSDDLARMIAAAGVISATYEAASSTSMSDILTRLQRAEAKVEDVRKMHWRAKRSDGSLYAFCEGCQEYWPCPTVKVLGEES